MKKRALILAMIAFIAATTSEPSINMVRAEETQVEETQVEETQTEENAGQTSELPIKTLTPKVMDVNPYMAASVPIFIMTAIIQIQQMRYCLLIFILRSMFLMKKLIPMLPRQSFLIPMDILWFRFWVAWRSVILMQMRHRPWAIFHQNSMTMEAI